MKIGALSYMAMWTKHIYLEQSVQMFLQMRNLCLRYKKSDLANLLELFIKKVVTLIFCSINPLSTSKKMYILYQWGQIDPSYDSYFRVVFAVLYFNFCLLST